jgi:dolichol-phosphate mannosyltransferase
MAGRRVVSIVLPVYNEAKNIQECLRRLSNGVGNLQNEILVCYDFDGDSTLPLIQSMEDRPPTLRLVKNDLGRGVAYAMRAGFAAADGDVVVTTMADLSDPPELIPSMAEKVRAGAAVVSGSRYMSGGRQVGGPRLKAFLSRTAGLSLHFLSGLPTRDPTTNFRAYAADFVRNTPVESTQGFELALELTVKAYRAGLPIDEVPTTWQGRVAGESRFRMWKWMPAYLRWYVLAFGPARYLAGAATVLSVAFVVLCWTRRSDGVP